MKITSLLAILIVACLCNSESDARSHKQSSTTTSTASPRHASSSRSESTASDDVDADSKPTFALTSSNAGACKLLTKEPEAEHDKVKIVSTPKNRAALQLAAHMVFKDGSIVPIEPTSVDYENSRHWEILKVKSPCVDVDLLFVNSSVFEALSFGHVEVQALNGAASKLKTCMFHTPSEDKRSRFKKGMECLRAREYSCDDDYSDGAKNVAQFKIRTLRVEFGRNIRQAPRDAFESPVSQFTQCKSREEVEERKRKYEERKKMREFSTTALPDVISGKRSTTTKPKFAVDSDADSGLDSAPEDTGAADELKLRKRVKPVTSF